MKEETLACLQGQEEEDLRAKECSDSNTVSFSCTQHPQHPHTQHQQQAQHDEEEEEVGCCWVDMEDEDQLHVFEAYLKGVPLPTAAVVFPAPSLQQKQEEPKKRKENGKERKRKLGILSPTENGESTEIKKPRKHSMHYIQRTKSFKMATQMAAGKKFWGQTPTSHSRADKRSREGQQHTALSTSLSEVQTEYKKIKGIP